MACGCTGKLNMNKSVHNDIQSNNKTLSADSIQKLSTDEIINLYRQGYTLEERIIENDNYINGLTYATANKTDYTSGRDTTTIQIALSTSTTATWYLYYTTNPCGSGHNSALSYIKNTDTLKTEGTILVPCEVDYNAYVIEFFINYMMQYYGLLDTDTIYVNDVLYTKRWACTTTTGICSQIDGPGYASKAKCTGIWPCNPDQWHISGANGLTGTVTVSGNLLAWSVIPKGETETITFYFGNKGYTPIIYTDTAGIDQIGVYIPDSNTYAINTSYPYHGGNADAYVPDSYEVTTISNIPGFVKQISIYEDNMTTSANIVSSTGYVYNSNRTVLMCLYENKASLGYTKGMVKFQASRHDVGGNMCYQDTSSLDIQCAQTTAYELKNIAYPSVNGQGTFNYGCIEVFNCSAGDNCNTQICSTWGSRIGFITNIPIRATNTSHPLAPTGLVITPGNGTLTIGWNSVADPSGGEVFAYNVMVFDGTTSVANGYTEAGRRIVTIGNLTSGKQYSIQIWAKSHNGYLSMSAAMGTGVPSSVTLPSVFSICWGTTVPTNCGNSPPQSPIVAGTLFTIKADLENSGPAGKVKVVFKNGTTIINTQETANLGTFPSGGLWSPSFTFTMPASDIALVVEAHGWDGASYILKDTKQSTISSIQTCSLISLDPFSQTVNVGETVNFTATTSPSTSTFTVNFKLRDDTLLASVATTGGIARYAWTAPLTEGTYYVHAEVGTPAQCISTESVIEVSPPIIQHSVNINVKDSITSIPIQGASVTIATQTLQTDSSGHVLFRVDQGTIYITISKTGYNTITSDPQYIYNDVTINYSLIPVSANPGSLRFVTSPPGISGAEVHFIGDSPTLKGTTDANGIFFIGNLVANRVVNYEVRKTGYNTATGSKTVVGNVQTDVVVTMTPLATTGSVCIHSSPPGASIKIGGVLQTGKTTAVSGGGCTTSNTIDNLASGSHSYELSLDLYQNKTGTFNITVGQTLDYDAGALTQIPTLGSVEIWSTPGGARIYLLYQGVYRDTGYVTGTASAHTVKTGLPAATYNYKLKLAGYNDYTDSFVITAGHTTMVSPTLVPAPPIASIGKVFNACWGQDLGNACAIPPQRPVVVSGTNVSIKADMVNIGATGKIRAVFKIGGVSISDQNTLSLAPFPGGGFWNPTTTYLMPNSDIVLTIEAYGWDGATWILNDTKTGTISATAPTCTGISIDASTVIANVGDTITLTAYDVTPITQPFLVTFTDRNNLILGTCTTSNGTCSIQWDTTGLPQGTYYVKVAVIGSCTSTELAVGLSIPTQQWNVDINVKDYTTTNPIQGASVTIGTQTLQTDSVGHVQFRVDQGTIYITISKTGYNTVNSDPQSVYNNVIFDYPLVLTTANPGSLNFLTVPSGAEVFFGTVSKGTTNIVTGLLQIDNLPAGQLVNYTVKKTGYNDSSGSITVQSGTVLPVVVTLTLITPTTGNVCMKSSPSGASIKIDGVVQSGKTTAISGGGCVSSNIVYNLSLVSHSFELSLTGFQNNTGNFTPIAGQTIDNDVTLTPLPNLGIVNISSTPVGAKIYIKSGTVYLYTGYVTGTPEAPAVIGSLIAGIYDYKLTLDGYNDYVSTFTIMASQTTTLSIALVATPPTTGTLSIWSSPPGARIWTKLGTGDWQDTLHITGTQASPTLITGLSPGDYSYKLVLAQYEDYIYTGTLTIDAGQTVLTNAALVPIYIPPTLTTITISPESQLIGIGGNVQLEAVCKDQNTQTIDCLTLEWVSSDSSKATVDSTGKVTGITEGTANITAKYETITSNSSSITISSSTSILTTILPISTSVLINTTQQFRAMDQLITQITTGVTWAMVSGVGTIDENGLYSAGATAGTARISATYLGITLHADINVTESLPPAQEGGGGMLFGIVGVAVLGIMMSSKKPQERYKEGKAAGK